MMRMMQSTRAARRGLSLIEMLVVITASAMIIGLIVGVIQMLIRADRTARDHLVRSAAVNQLSRSLTQQVRAAVKADCVQRDETATLQLKLGDDADVEFQSRTDTVIRTDREAGQVRRQEKYTLPARSEARFEVRVEGMTTTVSLEVLQRRGQGQDGPVRELRVDATLGRDYRFATQKD